jgi:hypothetical protein
MFCGVISPSSMEPTEKAKEIRDQLRQLLFKHEYIICYKADLQPLVGSRNDHRLFDGATFTSQRWNLSHNDEVPLSTLDVLFRIFLFGIDCCRTRCFDGKRGLKCLEHARKSIWNPHDSSHIAVLVGVTSPNLSHELFGLAYWSQKVELFLFDGLIDGITSFHERSCHVHWI